MIGGRIEFPPNKVEIDEVRENRPIVQVGSYECEVSGSRKLIEEPLVCDALIIQGGKHGKPIQDGNLSGVIGRAIFPYVDEVEQPVKLAVSAKNMTNVIAIRETLIKQCD